jgi:hypothetical protein
MSRVRQEANLAALRSFYAERMRHAPPSEAERIQSHVAALEVALNFPASQFGLLRHLAVAHRRGFVLFAQRLASPVEFPSRRGESLSLK